MTDSSRPGCTFIVPREGIGVGVDRGEIERSRRWRTVSGSVARSGETHRQLADALHHAFDRVDKLAELQVSDRAVLRYPLCKLANDLRDAVLVRLLLSETCEQARGDLVRSHCRGY